MSAFIRNIARTHNLFYLGDLISTGWGRRDSIINWLAYIIQMGFYHINISTIHSFYYGPKRLKQYVNPMVKGLVWYWSFYVLCYIMSGCNIYFVMMYLTFPMAEGLIFLAGVNWSWHLFTDPNDFNNEFVASQTLFNGPSNVLNEDYHVVHHTYPAHHWTKHPQLFIKHKDEYIKNKASVFQGTHAMELFYFGVTCQYEAIYDKYDKEYLPNMCKQEIIELIKERIKCTFFDENGNYKQLYIDQVLNQTQQELTHQITKEN